MLEHKLSSECFHSIFVFSKTSSNVFLASVIILCYVCVSMELWKHDFKPISACIFFGLFSSNKLLFNAAFCICTLTYILQLFKMDLDVYKVPVMNDNIHV